MEQGGRAGAGGRRKKVKENRAGHDPCREAVQQLPSCGPLVVKAEMDQLLGGVQHGQGPVVQFTEDYKT